MTPFCKSFFAASMAAAASAACAVTVWPDYFGITVPPNIAPLDFEVRDLPPGARVEAAMTGRDGSRLVASGAEIVWNERGWKKFLGANKGGSYEIALSIRTNGAEMAAMAATNLVSASPIDSHLAYRLIPPSYTGFSEMGTYLRDLTSFDERPLYRNIQADPSQCVNCHTHNRANPSNYLFHTRAYEGGTTIVSPKYGKFKVDLKAEGLISGGVYPAWHPGGDYIVFSVNETRQSFFATNPEKIEVMDLRSDLVMYSLADNTITVIEDSPEDFECFPTWTPDGAALFSVRARTGFTDMSGDDAIRGERVFNSATNIFYDLVVRSFDEKTRKFSPPETDRDADLFIFDFDKKTIRPLVELNSPDTESYHTFSSDGEWMVFSSRRDDGAYTRPYFAKFDKAAGAFSKPFLLPLKHPSEHRRRMKSYNIPEFSAGPVAESPAELHDLTKSKPRKAAISR